VTGIALSFAGALAVGFLVQAATLPLVRRATQDEEPLESAGLELLTARTSIDDLRTVPRSRRG
jgi:hypothetical protein